MSDEEHRAIMAAVAAGGNEKVTYRTIAGVDHNFEGALSARDALLGNTRGVKLDFVGVAMDWIKSRRRR
jgi:hypothetical protein